MQTEFLYILYTDVSLQMDNMQSMQLSYCVTAENNGKYM